MVQPMSGDVVLQMKDGMNIVLFHQNLQMTANRFATETKSARGILTNWTVLVGLLPLLLATLGVTGIKKDNWSVVTKEMNSIEELWVGSVQLLE